MARRTLSLIVFSSFSFFYDQLCKRSEDENSLFPIHLGSYQCNISAAGSKSHVNSGFNIDDETSIRTLRFPHLVGNSPTCRNLGWAL
jgi:hypothetical protein